MGTPVEGSESWNYTAQTQTPSQILIWPVHFKKTRVQPRHITRLYEYHTVMSYPWFIGHIRHWPPEVDPSRRVATKRVTSGSYSVTNRRENKSYSIAIKTIFKNISRIVLRKYLKVVQMYLILNSQLMW